ncbi:hypothetical protein Vadar_022566 [Vaccinium darrowii]|uniref:Uncharacterized protein n=1 Tax=Vaccinium darrowii TaxID=229202 RepID=A0ACB7YXM0_9ERIC|nr:hypothetical protein Vadar_022566 [Vaccinium darrowii]
MASSFSLRNFSTCSYLIQYFLLILTFSVSTKHTLGFCYTSIFSFGDSLADTGNLLHIAESSTQPPQFALPPYGETYFHRPTGRCSDGRLIIDFIAQDLGMPLVPPYFRGQNESVVNFQEGVNFAVGGSTALDKSFFEERGIHNPFTNSSFSLRDQLGWFKEMLSSLCHSSSDCKQLLSSSLILMGEIGGNDYNGAFASRRSLQEIRSFVPIVIDAISSAITELIELGAMTLMVPGNLPIGCIPYLLTDYMSSIKEDYDRETGCLIWLNEFAVYHNEMLRIELNRIQELHPHTTIIYADYYNAAMRFYRSPFEYGFNGSRVLKACCGAKEGPYDVNLTVLCGYPPSTPCDDPSSYVSWDGTHLTEAAYRWISKSLLEGPYTIPPINLSCISFPATTESKVD